MKQSKAKNQNKLVEKKSCAASIKKILLWVAATTLTPLLYLKFIAEQRVAGFEKGHWKLYKIIHFLSAYHNHRFPNLTSPKTYNDKIQWLKLFDQSQVIVECSDKIRMKNYVARAIGEKYVPEVYVTSNSPWNIDLDKLPEKFVLKTNHDSGTVYLIRNKDTTNWNDIFEEIELSLSKIYGWSNGEWAYSMIEPMVFAEEYLGEAGETPPPDFKFHCSNGRVLWLQYIYDRGLETKEVIVSPEGKVMDIQFDHNMKKSNEFSLPDCFEKMKNVAGRLSVDFKYVRIDLYLINKKIYVGEMTFYPLMGCYKGRGQRELGKLLDFDTTSRKSVIYTQSKIYH